MKPVLIVLFCAGTLLHAASGTDMSLTSPDFTEGAAIPSRFTTDGADIHPALDISGIPPGTKSLVLIVDDPDAPAGTWNHWLLWNIDPATTGIPAGTVPPGAIQGRSDFGTAKYTGPSPPSGTHRYYFRLFALASTLSLPPGSTRPALDQALQGRILATATFMGRYSRSR